MDEIDVALLQAWDRMSRDVRDKPRHRARRLARARRPAMQRPLRPWCLALRAGDTRLSDQLTAHPEALVQIAPHAVPLTAQAIRRLCQPLRLPWPGLPLRQAAARLGVQPDRILGLIRSGVLASDRFRQGRLWRRRVYAFGPIDPGGLVRHVHQEWGSLWQSAWEKVDPGYAPTLQRQAVRCGAMWKWRWVCPGRDEVPGGCGRLVDKLYYPLPTPTVLNFRGGEPPMPLPLRQDWTPGFACGRCWQIQGTHPGRDPERAWNHLVTYLSGGLLWGRNVPRPEGAMEADYSRYGRKAGLRLVLHPAPPRPPVLEHTSPDPVWQAWSEAHQPEWAREQPRKRKGQPPAAPPADPPLPDFLLEGAREAAAREAAERLPPLEELLRDKGLMRLHRMMVRQTQRDLRAADAARRKCAAPQRDPGACPPDQVRTGPSGSGGRRPRDGRTRWAG